MERERKGRKPGGGVKLTQMITDMSPVSLSNNLQNNEILYG